jgi:CcmD family protein
MSQSQAPTASPDDRSTAFRAVEGGSQMQSGEMLLVEAYAAIWVIVFALVFFTWRRQKKIDARVAALEAAVAKARGSEGAREA